MEPWPIRLQRLRNAVRPKLSQAKVAKHFGISAPSVAQWETGRSRPEIDKLPRLATLYGVSLETLCGEDLPLPSEAMGGPQLQASDEVDKFVEEQLLFLKDAWLMLTTEERTAILTTVRALAAPRRKPV